MTPRHCLLSCEELPSKNQNVGAEQCRIRELPLQVR